MIIDSYISKENVYYEDLIPLEEKKANSKLDDKLEILKIGFWYLEKGTFKDQFGKEPSFSNLNLSKEIKQELETYQNKIEIPSNNYYFEDILEYLIKKGYESPVILSRNK